MGGFFFVKASSRFDSFRLERNFARFLIILGFLFNLISPMFIVSRRLNFFP